MFQSIFNLLIDFFADSYMHPFYILCGCFVILGFCSVLVKGFFYEVTGNV